MSSHNPWCDCAQCQPRACDEDTAAPELASVDTNHHMRGTDIAELTAGYVLKQIYHLTATVKKANRQYMPSASAAAAAKKGEGAPMLHGSDVPKKKWNGFSLTILDVREAPDNWTGLFIMDFEPCGFKNADGADITSLALNKTNTAAIAAKLGDDTDRWAKKKIDFIVAMARNPKTKKPAPSIMVADE